MNQILRDPSGATDNKYDLIIVGGGVYGVMLSLEASQRGLRTLLLERDDFGAHTSFNSLRIIHGGLRYLQTLDLPRFLESVQERSWFLRTFPTLVKPLPCLMPLYGNGFKRPSIFSFALWINHLLSINRNNGLVHGQDLPAGGILDPDRTCSLFPMVDRRGLQGSAYWYDAYMPDSQLLLMNVLHWSCKLGTTALNYVEAIDLIKTKDDSVGGVIAIDRNNEIEYKYHSSVVVNATGPWCREFASKFDRDIPPLFTGSLVWNVLLDRPSISSHALAISPRKPGGRIYFLVPWKNKILAGTGHAPMNSYSPEPIVDKNMILEFLDEINYAIPGFNIKFSDVQHVFPGLLPVNKLGSVDLCKRPFILEHAKIGGLKGFFSVSGVKFTTARRVAQKLLSLTHPDIKVDQSLLSSPVSPIEYYTSTDQALSAEVLSRIIKESSVQHLDDLIFRRTALWENIGTPDLLHALIDLFDWDISRSKTEISRISKLTY